MKIGFLAVNASDPGCTFRAKWPAQWINKFAPGHAAFFLTSNDVQCSEAFSLFRNCDAVVIHKQSRGFAELAAKIKAKYPHVIIIFDQDDYDPLVWDFYSVDRYFHRVDEHWTALLELCDGFIGASVPLAERVGSETGKPSRCIENGYDLTLTQYRCRPQEYFSSVGPEGDFVKVAYGGGNNHYREMDMFLRWGILEDLADRYRVDFHFYGIVKTGGNMTVKREKGGIYSHNGASMDSYLQRLYTDAQVLLAPLCDEPFNDYRSAIKLVEAGVARKPIIASNRLVYDTYHTHEAVRIVENNRDAWYSAIEHAIQNADECSRLGAIARDGVERYNNADYLTKQRIDFITTLQAKK